MSTKEGWRKDNDERRGIEKITKTSGEQQEKVEVNDDIRGKRQMSKWERMEDKETQRKEE